jgi:ubiquinone/menaquinone biosynthesis C-methylase UbiE
MQQPGEVDLYTRLAPFYDWMSRGLLAPFGGDTRFRTQVIDAWSIRRGDRVLELGCGTGLMTRLLLDRGATVTAVDRSRPMLDRARERAPEATFIEHDVPSFTPRRAAVTTRIDRESFAPTPATTDALFDRVILSYILHELDRGQRAATLAMARDALAPGGLVGIVDFDDSAREPVRTAIDLYLRVAEPPSAREWARDGFREEVSAAGLRVVRSEPIGWGTARVGLCAPA